jgi:hypothetical protein
MKIEHLLVQHFYNTKQVTLQGVGTFTLSPDFILPADNDKDQSIPPGAISFQFNPKAVEDDALINFIVQQTRKIKPLASADLESYLMLASQFLNIGKPFKIDGIGMLEKNQTGEFTFTQEGQFMTSLKEEIQLQVREKSGDDISFTSKSKPSGNNNTKKIAGILGLLVIAAGIVIGGFYLATKTKKVEPVTYISPVTEPTNIIIIDPSKKDSTPVAAQNPAPVPATITGGYTFKIVFKVTNNKAAAIDKMNTLVYRGHKVIMYTADSVTYKLAEPFNLPLSDTAKIKDSLNRFYYLGKAKVELN